MDVKKEIIRRTTPYKGEIDYIVDDQSTKDIINAMIESHGLDNKDYDKICSLFDAESAEDVGYNIWIFLRENVDYVVETENLQTVRSPGALMATANAWGADCKNYSLFTGGVIDALNRKGAGIPWVYRFASYKWLKKDPYHVFVVMYPGTQDEIWIDAVLPYYNYHKQPSHFKDKKIMGLARVSGVGTAERRYIVGLNGRVRIAGPGDDGGGDDYTYYEESDPVDDTGGSIADGTSGFDLSSGAGAAAASQSGPDLGSSDLVNPSSGATAATPGQLDSNLYQDPTTGDYYNPDLTDTAAQEQALADAQAAQSPLSKIWSALTGGGGSGSGGGGASGGGASGASASQQKQPTQQQQTGTGTNIYLPASGSSSNTTLYIILGAGALLAIILLMRKK